MRVTRLYGKEWGFQINSNKWSEFHNKYFNYFVNSLLSCKVITANIKMTMVNQQLHEYYVFVSKVSNIGRD